VRNNQQIQANVRTFAKSKSATERTTMQQQNHELVAYNKELSALLSATRTGSVPPTSVTNPPASAPNPKDSLGILD